MKHLVAALQTWLAIRKLDESVTCKVHGEGHIEKLIDGQYTSAMENGRFTAPSTTLDAAGDHAS